MNDSASSHDVTVDNRPLLSDMGEGGAVILGPR
eukprot:CAMPEP_0174313866 /NCGR_PEP_ID=MMETSP0810-20121108/5274_1 /TAXON_ID=73025 ORGANISM="Eutreptiella gymnastica-like, Strain CCMP1594" /NCGR_SAMPLE_ID=MMETSP0810 /ASSEMBLY_ACC=CAM_ASM_000659 /LENGTH=32 /DNA_ID= /DNA_START= /DNA_END= /DNA_ORIENTATION=